MVLLTVLAPPAAGAEDTDPRADAAVQVTATPTATRAHAVPTVAIHPDDPRTLAVAEGDAYAGRCTLHVSTNAGLTWTARPLPDVPEWPRCNMFASFGPVTGVAFSQDGTLYVVRSGIDPSTYHQRVILDRTTDLGASFETTVLPWVEPDLDAGQFGADGLPTVVADRDEAGRVYVGWMSNNGTWNLSEEVL
ncbi:MAG: hypothetical protein M3N57_09515, partial [Actinomycetota bacterium]|nr:hypothetical protein [Actinomycetota bacterium]